MKTLGKARELSRSGPGNSSNYKNSRASTRGKFVAKFRPLPQSRRENLLETPWSPSVPSPLPSSSQTCSTEPYAPPAVGHHGL